MPLLTWQLWLAREIVKDNPLPWQKPQQLGQLTPGRVAQSFSGLLAALPKAHRKRNYEEFGTPARLPKPRGKSPGCTKGQKRTKKNRYPVVKKRYSPPPKEQKEAS